MTAYTKVTKSQAKKLFNQGSPIYLCPNKMYPSGSFNMACLVFGKEYLEAAERYRTNPTLWEGTLEETAWGLMYRNWVYYNATYETGYYASYYIEG